jgi:predicted nucleic-acid-binding Zn-ribbon protein
LFHFPADLSQRVAASCRACQSMNFASGSIMITGDDFKGT